MPEIRNSVQQLLGEMDIYLIDQIMKNRYKINDRILDTGCGTGRNLYWFINHAFDIYGIDADEEVINELKTRYSHLPDDHLQVMPLEETLFPDNHFHHIISSAVFHFANGTLHFRQMISEMVRVLKPGGSLFIRMTSDIGIEKEIEVIGDGVYLLPDGSKRFLLTRKLLNSIMQQFNLLFLEPLKTVNVNDIRCMSTILLRKN